MQPPWLHLPRLFLLWKLQRKQNSHAEEEERGGGASLFSIQCQTERWTFGARDRQTPRQRAGQWEPQSNAISHHKSLMTPTLSVCLNSHKFYTTENTKRNKKPAKLKGSNTSSHCIHNLCDLPTDALWYQIIFAATWVMTLSIRQPNCLRKRGSNPSLQLIYETYIILLFSRHSSGCCFLFQTLIKGGHWKKWHR